MIRIEHPYYLLALLVILFLLWLYFRYSAWRKKVLHQFGEWSLVKQLIPRRSFLLNTLRLILLLLSLSLITMGLANVQTRGGQQQVKHEGLDIAIVFDASNSMLAEDVHPNRLEVARQFAAQIIDNLPDARIALIGFAGKPILLSALTIDHGAVQLLLDQISTTNIPEQGSDIGAALLEASKALPLNQNHYRVMVLITDGEDHEGKVTEALKEISDENIVICTAGIGTLQGAAVLELLQGEKTVKHQENGETVISKLHADVLTDIAERNHGLFVQPDATSLDAINEILKYLDGVSKNEFDEEILAEYESRFQWLLFPALVLLALEMFLISRRPVHFRNP